MTTYVIIGGGAAGMAAAGAIRSRDAVGPILILSSDPHFYYSRPGLAYVLSREIPEKQVFPFPRETFLGKKFQLIDQEAVSISPQAHTVQLGNGLVLNYDRLLIATGATASMPDVPGIHLDGVVKLDSLGDARHIVKTARRARRAVLVGGGITAIELVEGLMAQRVETHYFLRGNRYWSAVLDEVESRLVESRLAKDGARIHFHTNLVEILGKKGRVCGVIAEQDGQPFELACQMVAVAIGIQPRMDLAVDADLDTQRGILVDANLRTSDPDVFAAGDVAQVYHSASQQYLLDSLWNPAVQQGTVAGINMAGGNITYEKKFPFNVTRLAGVITTIIGQVGRGENTALELKGDLDVAGIMRGDSETWRLSPEAIIAQSYSGDNRLRLYLKENHLVGAVVMGDQTLSRPIQVFIQEQVDLASRREQLLAENADLPTILTTLWNDYRHLHAPKVQ